MRRAMLGLAVAALIPNGCDKPVSKEQPPVVLAAASMQEALSEAANSWSSTGHPKPVLSFAASSALARQIESGARADLFVSADEDWMNQVESQGLAKPGSRRILVRNALVLIGPVQGPHSVALTAPSLKQALGQGRMAMADPDSVPAGKYGKAALQKLGLWPTVQDKIASGENVRAALSFVERGEVPLGIVYITDAKASKKVRIVATFPEKSHPPIVYPIALLKSGRPEGDAFERFLASSRGQAIFASYGFTPGGADAHR